MRLVGRVMGLFGVISDLGKDSPTIAIKGFTLYDNYPNPFNPSTVIRYELPYSDRVELSIYSVQGRRIVSLVNDHQTAGIHEVVWKASRFASGVYYYRLQTASGFVAAKKLVLLK